MQHQPALVGFADPSEGGRYVDLTEAMGDMLAVPLFEDDMLRLVDRAELARVMAEHRLGALRPYQPLPLWSSGLDRPECPRRG